MEPELEAELFGRLGGGPASALLRALLDSEQYAKAGLDGSGPLWIVPSETGGTVVLGFSVADRPLFLRWLGQLDDPKFVPLLGERALVLGTNTDLPIACQSTTERAYCQFGAASDDAPLLPLEQVLRLSQTGRSTAGIKSAQEALPKDARWYAIFEPSVWVDRMAQQRLEALRQRHRFESPKARKGAEDQLRAAEQRWKRTGRAFDGGALAVVRSPGRVEFQVELGLSSLGAKALEELTPKQAGRRVLARWAETPALLHGLIHADPRIAQALLANLEAPEVPLEALDGSLAFLIYGVDCDCDAAKKRIDPRPLDWAFLFPSAIAIGRSDREIPAWPTTTSTLASSAANLSTAPHPPRQVIRTTPNGRFELQVLDEALVFSAGPGSAAAALRRFNSLPTLTEAPGPGPSLGLKIHLKAIDAALAANALGLEHRPEVLMFEAMRLKARPLIDLIQEIQVSAQPSADRRRARLTLRLGHEK